MKHAVILHGTDATPDDNWFPWLKAELAQRDYEVWAPQLPGAHAPNAKNYTEFLLSSGWNFQDNLLVGHSSGAVEILHLLQSLPENVSVRTAVSVGAFSEALAEKPEWAQLKGLFEEPFDFAKIKTKARDFLFVHGSDDPWCDPREAQTLAQKLGGEYVEIPGGQHFSTSLDPNLVSFPKLLQLLEDRELL